VKAVTDGGGADVVIDATHRASRLLTEAVRMVAIGGTIVVAGLKMDRVELNTDGLIVKDVTLRGANGHDVISVEAALGILERGDLPFEDMCTHTYTLEETEKAVLTVGGEGDPDPIHVTVVPS